MELGGISIEAGAFKEAEEEAYDPDKSGVSSVMPPKEGKFMLGGEDPLSVEKDPGCMEDTEAC